MTLRRPDRVRLFPHPAESVRRLRFAGPVAQRDVLTLDHDFPTLEGMGRRPPRAQRNAGPDDRMAGADSAGGRLGRVGDEVLQRQRRFGGTVAADEDAVFAEGGLNAGHVVERYRLASQHHQPHGSAGTGTGGAEQVAVQRRRRMVDRNGLRLDPGQQIMPRGVFRIDRIQRRAVHQRTEDIHDGRVEAVRRQQQHTVGRIDMGLFV